MHQFQRAGIFCSHFHKPMPLCFLLLQQNTVPSKAKALTELYHKNFLFFTRWHEMTIFRKWKAKKSHWTAHFSHCHLSIQFLSFYSYANTETLYTIMETLIQTRKLPACFRVCIRVLPTSTQNPMASIQDCRLCHC